MIAMCKKFNNENLNGKWEERILIVYAKEYYKAFRVTDILIKSEYNQEKEEFTISRYDLNQIR